MTPLFIWPHGGSCQQAPVRTTRVRQRSNCSFLTQLHELTSFYVLRRLGLRPLLAILVLRRQQCRRCALRTHRKPALRDQIHGALDGNVHGAGFLVDPAVAVQRVLFAADECRSVGRARLLPASGRETFSADSPVQRNVARIRRDVRDQRIHGGLQGLFAMIEKREKTPEHQECRAASPRPGRGENRERRRPAGPGARSRRGPAVFSCLVLVPSSVSCHIVVMRYTCASCAGCRTSWASVS